MLDKVLRDDVEAVPERHEGYGLLAEHPIGLADDRSLEHPGMGVQDILDLLRVDVLPAPDDQVLDPVDQGEVAVVVEPADVAGVQPSAAQRLGRLLRPAAACRTRPPPPRRCRAAGGPRYPPCGGRAAGWRCSRPCIPTARSPPRRVRRTAARTRRSAGAASGRRG